MILCLFSILLLVDLAVSLYLLLIYGTLQDTSSPECQLSQGNCPTDYTAFVIILAAYPFAYVLSPIIGLMSLLFWLPIWIKRFIQWNLGSILSSCVSVLLYLCYYDDLLRMNLCLSTSQVIVKFLLAIIAQIHLASMLKQSDNDRRRRLRNSGSGDRFGVLESKF
jgi:hypothetical protein